MSKKYDVVVILQSGKKHIFNKVTEYLHSMQSLDLVLEDGSQVTFDKKEIKESVVTESKIDTFPINS